MNDNIDHERAAALVQETREALRIIGLAKQAAHQRSHLTPRPPARFSPIQLAEAYRRERLRNPHRPTLRVVPRHA